MDLPAPTRHRQQGPRWGWGGVAATPLAPVRVSPTRVLLCRLLQALGTIYELLYTREYKATVRWAFAGLLVGLLTQLRYLFELGAADGISDYEEDVLEVRPLSPCR